MLHRGVSRQGGRGTHLVHLAGMLFLCDIVDPTIFIAKHKLIRYEQCKKLGKTPKRVYGVENQEPPTHNSKLCSSVFI